MWAWACEQKMVWWTLLVLLMAYALIHVAPLSMSVSDRIRYVGTALQVAGIGTVWAGLEKTRRLFGFQYSFVALWQWLHRMPYNASKRDITMQLEGAAFSSSSGSVDLTAGKIPQSELEALTLRVAEIEKRFQRNLADLDRRINTLSQAHQRAQDEHSARVTAVEGRLLAAQTGGLDLSLGGLVWLAIGVIATCMPEEVSHLLFSTCRNWI
jgi:hypothetical protein